IPGVAVVADATSVVGASITAEAAVKRMNARQRLTYRFFSLSYLARLDVARELSLLQDEDAGITSEELGRRVFQRAREQRKLGQLWVAVEQRYQDPAQNNPFAGI